MSARPILYFDQKSAPCRTVLLVARAINLDLELIEVNAATKENYTPELFKLNPQRTVPTLDDNGRGICDSHAIATYLIGKYGKTDDPLYPNDLYIRAKVDERLHFDNGVVFAALKDIYWPFIFDGVHDIIPKAFDSSYKAYDLLETFLAVDPFVVGKHLTVADFSIATIVTQMAQMIPIDEVKYPKLLQWIRRVEELPYFIEINTKPLKPIIAVFREMIQKRKAATESK